MTEDNHSDGSDDEIPPTLAEVIAHLEADESNTIEEWDLYMGEWSAGRDDVAHYKRRLEADPERVEQLQPGTRLAVRSTFPQRRPDSADRSTEDRVSTPPEWAIKLSEGEWVTNSAAVERNENLEWRQIGLPGRWKRTRSNVPEHVVAREVVVRREVQAVLDMFTSTEMSRSDLDTIRQAIDDLGGSDQ